MIIKNRNNAKPIDLLSLIAHDFRNSVNAINMSAHMIRSDMPEGYPDLDADVQLLQESIGSLTEMLKVLTDIAGVLERTPQVECREFDSREMLAEVITDVERDAACRDRIALRYDDSCPDVVNLDPGIVRKALVYAVKNTLNHADGAMIELSSLGVGDRWVIMLHDPVPMNLGGQSGDGDGDSLRMTRLLSCRRERRGADLEIAARLCEYLGGSVRLSDRGDLGAELRLDWPVNAAD